MPVARAVAQPAKVKIEMSVTRRALREAPSERAFVSSGPCDVERLPMNTSSH